MEKANSLPAPLLVAINQLSGMYYPIEFIPFSTFNQLISVHFCNLTDILTGGSITRSPGLTDNLFQLFTKPQPNGAGKYQ